MKSCDPTLLPSNKAGFDTHDVRGMDTRVRRATRLLCDQSHSKDHVSCDFDPDHSSSGLMRYSKLLQMVNLEHLDFETEPLASKRREILSSLLPKVRGQQ